MSKRLILALAFVASTAWAQQNVDISAEQFNSGDANGTLASLGRQAAATGKKLVITAPAHWHARIAASIRSGGNADICSRMVSMKTSSCVSRLVPLNQRRKKPNPSRPNLK